MNTKVLFYLTLPILGGLILQSVGVLPSDGNTRTSNPLLVTVAFIVIGSFFILWYYMLVDSYKNNMKLFWILLLLPIFTWLYYIFFFKRN
ncbi:hypothetical protein A9Q79_02275 [Methylophaga sp. 42_25_T18]|nr:hypothetical protein A9Q79_02275 [Methylophaga sp. 42_25_T18]OUR87169.1 hypothetical protein A9Q92_04720 [Methylophaga sp. 42_8_T64]